MHSPFKNIKQSIQNRAKKLKISSITAGTLIDEDQVEQARNAGLCLHHEVQYEEYGYPTDEEGVYDWVNELVRDEWYAASPGWVVNYLRTGGTWAYND